MRDKPLYRDQITVRRGTGLTRAMVTFRSIRSGTKVRARDITSALIDLKANGGGEELLRAPTVKERRAYKAAESEES